MDEFGPIDCAIPRRVVPGQPPVFNEGWVYCDRITAKSLQKVTKTDLVTLLDYYTHYYRHSDRKTWRQRIEAGQVLANDLPVSPDAPLMPGQRLSYHRPPWQEPSVPLDFVTLYEDEVLWVIHKPSGLPVLPGGNFLQHTLLWQLRQRCATAAPIHRLGRGTSGLVLIAKTKAARAHLSRQMRQRQLGKTYRTLIGPAGSADLPGRFTITQPIGKIPYPQLGHIYGATAEGAEAHSNCRILQRRPDTTLLEVTILTGRPHQIRIHLAAMGHPLLHDPLYVVGGQPHPDGSAIPSDCGYWLHAWQLSFMHPIGEPMVLTCDPPDELVPS